MASMDFTNMNMNTEFFSWIISADISILLKIYDMNMNMPNFHGYYPWGALLLSRRYYLIVEPTKYLIVIAILDSSCLHRVVMGTDATQRH